MIEPPPAYETVDSLSPNVPKFSTLFSLYQKTSAVYYRLYDDHKIITSKAAFNAHDNLTGRFDPANLSPPRSVAVVKRRIAALESLVVAEISDLYLHADLEEPADDMAKSLAIADSPGSLVDRPLAVMINRNSRALKTGFCRWTLSKATSIKQNAHHVTIRNRPSGNVTGWKTAKVDSSYHLTSLRWSGGNNLANYHVGDCLPIGTTLHVDPNRNRGIRTHLRYGQVIVCTDRRIGYYALDQPRRYHSPLI